MPKLQIKAGTSGGVDLIQDLFIQDSSSAVGAGLSGLAHNTAGLTCKYKRKGQSSWTTVSLVSATAGTWTSGGFVAATSADAGDYELHLPEAAVAAGVPSVAVSLAGAANMLPVKLEIQLAAVDIQDAVRAGLTALPNANAGTSTGLATAQTIARTLTGAAAVYYVAKTGNDANDGLSPTSAKLTISSALTAASAGDTIRIAAGTYTEKVDLSAKANITLQGDGKSAVITQSSGGDAQNDFIVKVGNGATLRNLTLNQAYAGTQLATGATAIYGSGVANVLIDDVYITSTDSGVLIYDGRNTTIRNSRFDCSEIGINLATGESSGTIDGCDIRCTNWTYCSSYAITLGGGGMGNNSYVIRNTRAYVNRADYTGGQPYAIEVFGAHVVAQNCVFAAELGVAEGALPAQRVIAVLLNNNAGAGYEFASCLLLDGCVLSSIDVNGDVGAHIYNTDSYSTVYTTGTTIYDRSNIVGTVTDLAYTAASAASTAATNTGTILSRIGAFAGSGANTILGVLRAIFGKTATKPSDLNDLTAEPATDSLEAIRDRGDAAWTAATFNGANAVTINVKYLTTNISGATVTVTQGIITETRTTDASGNTSFSLNNGDYTLAIVKSGYSFTPETITISGAATLNKTLAAVVAPSATDPTQSRCSLRCYTQAGRADSAAVIYVEQTAAGADGAWPKDAVKYTCDSEGYLLDPVDGQRGIILARNVAYRAWRGPVTVAGAVTKVTFTPNAASFALPAILGRDGS